MSPRKDNFLTLLTVIWWTAFIGTMALGVFARIWWPFLIVGIPLWCLLCVGAYCSFIDLVNDWKEW